MRHIRIGWLIAIALGTLLGLYAASCGQDNRPDAHAQDGGEPGPTGKPQASIGRNTALMFYQVEPQCDGKQRVFLVLPGPAFTTEHHAIWVCGYRRNQ